MNLMNKRTNLNKFIIIITIILISILLYYAITPTQENNQEQFKIEDDMPLDDFSNLEYGMAFLQESVLKNFSAIPIAEEDCIDVIAENKTLVTYKKHYVIESMWRAKLSIETIYLGDKNCDLNSVEEFYLTKGRIFMHRTDKDGISASDYEGTMKNFKELIHDGVNDYYSFDYNPLYVNKYNCSSDVEGKKLQVTLKNDKIKNFLGTSDLPISNMSYDFMLLQNGKIKSSNFRYESFQNGKTVSVKINSNILLENKIEIPEWVI